MELRVFLTRCDEERTTKSSASLAETNGSCVDDNNNNKIDVLEELVTVADLISFCVSSDADAKLKALAVLKLNNSASQHLADGAGPPSQPSATLTARVLDAIRSPEFVSDWKGYRFLSKFIAAFPRKIRDVHGAVKSAMEQLPAMERVNGYGRMYLQAWNSGSHAVREIIWQVCVDGLLVDMMKLPRSADCYSLGELNRRLFNIVDYFFNKCAESAECAKQMSDTLRDVVWPRFRDASFILRCNAAEALFAAYPVEDPTMSREQHVAYLRHQHELMLGMFPDRSHFVRHVALTGVLDRVLTKYWHLVTDDMRKKFFDRICDFMSHDGDERVRLQVYRSFRGLLSKSEAVQELRDRLPDLRNNVHDTDEDVRLEFLKLLQAVRDRDLFPFYHVVPMDHFVARLAVDTGEVAKAIVRLLLPYFCPLELPQDTMLRRMYSMLLMNKTALRKLFLHSEGMLTTREVVALMVCLLDAVHESVSSGSPRTPIARPTIKKSTKKQKKLLKPPRSPEYMKASDPLAATGLLEVVAVLWAAHGPSLREPQAAALRQKLNETLPKMLEAFAGTDAVAPLQHLAQFHGQSDVYLDVLQDALEEMASAPEADIPAVVQRHSGLFLAKQDGADLLRRLADSVKSSWSRVSGARGLIPAGIAVRLLEEVLGAPEVFGSMHAEHAGGLEKLRSTLRHVQVLVETRLTDGSPLTERRKVQLSDDFIVRLFRLHLSFELAFYPMSAGWGAELERARAVTVSSCISLLDWAERQLVKRRPPAADAPPDVDWDLQKPLIVVVMRDLLVAVGQVVKAGVYDEQMLESRLEFSSLLAASAYAREYQALNADFLSMVLRAFESEAIPYSSSKLLWQEIFLPAVVGFLDELPALASGAAAAKGREQVHRVVIVTASMTYTALNLASGKLARVTPEATREIVSAVAKNVLQMVRGELLMTGADGVLPKTLQELPFSAHNLIGILLSTTLYFSHFLKSVIEWHSQAVRPKDAAMLSAVGCVLNALSHDSLPLAAIAKDLVKEAVNVFLKHDSDEEQEEEEVGEEEGVEGEVQEE